MASVRCSESPAARHAWCLPSGSLRKLKRNNQGLGSESKTTITTTGRGDVFMAWWSCGGCRRGALGWSSLVWDKRPTSEENTRGKQKSHNLFESPSPLFAHWPVSESQASTPVCRPCRWGSTWRRRSRWGTPPWCSSQDTCSRTEWAVAPSGGSWWW